MQISRLRGVGGQHREACGELPQHPADGRQKGGKVQISRLRGANRALGQQQPSSPGTSRENNASSRWRQTLSRLQKHQPLLQLPHARLVHAGRHPHGSPAPSAKPQAAPPHHMTRMCLVDASSCPAASSTATAQNEPNKATSSSNRQLTPWPGSAWWALSGLLSCNPQT